jgi:hypothetical protein
MATGRSGQSAEQARGESGGARPVNLEGDSPEVVAFALLRYLAQLEQPRASETGTVFDREWLLDAYADCLEAVKGERTRSSEASSSSSKTAQGRSPRR